MIDKFQELYQREMLYRVSSTLQNKHTYHLEECLYLRGSVPGNDHVKLKAGDAFVYTDLYGTYFQRSGAITLYLDNVLEMDLSSYTDEQISMMKKQNMLDNIFSQCHTSLLQYFDEFDFTYKDKPFYPIGMYVKYSTLMLHGSFSPERASTDVFCSFSQLKKVLK